MILPYDPVLEFLGINAQMSQMFISAHKAAPGHVGQICPSPAELGSNQMFFRRWMGIEIGLHPFNRMVLKSMESWQDKWGTLTYYSLKEANLGKGQSLGSGD